jgi:hypothetical protein
MKRARSTALTLKAALLVLPFLGGPADPATAAERELRGGLGLQANPLGLRAEVEASWKWSLSDSAHPLVKSAHVSVGISDQLSPASNQTQLWLQVSPLAILDIRAGATGIAYFGTFGNLVGFGGYDRDFRDETRKARSDEAVPGVGRRFHISPTLKFRTGRLSVRTSADFESWKVKDAPGTVFYEPNRGTLLDSTGDSLVSGSSVVLLDVSRNRGEKLRIGALHDYLKVWDAPRNARQRLGPLALIKIGKRRLGGRDPMVSLAVLKYLEAPNRSGIGGFVSMSFSLQGAKDR